jgi:hypothetical protein
MKKPNFISAKFFFEDANNTYSVIFIQQKDKTMHRSIIHKNNAIIYDELILSAANKTNALELLTKAIN